MALRTGSIREECPSLVKKEVNQEQDRLDDKNKDPNSASHSKGSSKNLVTTRFSIKQIHVDARGTTHLNYFLVFYCLVGFDFAVADVDDAVGSPGNVVFVGDHNDGVALLMQPRK